MKAKAVIYVRVSTEEQVKEGYSIEAQKQRGIDYCKVHGYDVVGIYVDEGISGKSLKRPAVQNMINDVKSKMFDIIVIYRLDRLSRSLKDLANLIDILDKYNVIIKSTSEELDLSSLSGRAMVQMLGVFAEFERGTIAERVAMGREQRARQGLYASPTRIFGYNYDKNTKTYSINETEANIVKEMFDLFCQGKGTYYLSRLFNARGYRTINGKKFYKTFFVRAFRDGWYYCGKFKYTTKAGEELLLDAKNIPNPILTVEEFERANKIYAASSVDTAKKHTKEIFVFKGKARCAYCNNLLRTNVSAPRTNKDGKTVHYLYYKCERKQQGLCEAKYWLASKLDEEFNKFLKEFATQDIEATVQLRYEQLETLQENKKSLEDIILKEKEKKKKLQHHLLEDVINKDEYLSLSRDLDFNINSLEESLKQCEHEIEIIKSNQQLEHEKKIAFNIAESWEKLNLQQKKEFVNMFIKTIYVGRDGITKVEFIL